MGALLFGHAWARNRPAGARVPGAAAKGGTMPGELLTVLTIALIVAVGLGIIFAAVAGSASGSGRRSGNGSSGNTAGGAVPMASGTYDTDARDARDLLSDGGLSDPNGDGGAGSGDSSSSDGGGGDSGGGGGGGGE